MKLTASIRGNWWWLFCLMVERLCHSKSSDRRHDLNHKSTSALFQYECTYKRSDMQNRCRGIIEIALERSKRRESNARFPDEYQEQIAASWQIAWIHLNNIFEVPLRNNLYFTFWKIWLVWVIVLDSLRARQCRYDYSQG